MRPQAGCMLLSRCADQPAPESNCEPEADLLSDDGPCQRFPRRRRKRDAQAALLANGGAEQFIAAELPFEAGAIRIESQHADPPLVNAERIGRIAFANRRIALEG